MPKSAFTGIFNSTFGNVRKLCVSWIRTMRLQLGMKVDELNTEVQRCQHLTQPAPRIFSLSYIANTTSVNDLSDFLGDQVEHRHVKYLRCLRKIPRTRTAL